MILAMKTKQTLSNKCRSVKTMFRKKTWKLMTTQLIIFIHTQVMMKKCLETGKDIQQGLLAIRNTPLACGASPAELLMNRQLNDNLPRAPALINTKQSKTRDLLAERNTQKLQYDKKIFTRTLPETFRPGQRVALQDPVSKEWSIRGQIVQEVAPRSFSVQISGTHQLLRRNRRHLRKLHSTTSTREDTNSHEQPERPEQQQHHESPDEQLGENSDYESDSDTIPYSDNDTYLALHEGQQISRSGRVIHPRKPMDYEEI